MMSTAPDARFEEKLAAEQPPHTTILLTYQGQVWICLPDAGNLWVGYEYQQQPAQSVYIWHQGGTTTPVGPGFAVYPVGANDFLVYQLVDPQQSIKLGWAYV